MLTSTNKEKGNGPARNWHPQQERNYGDLARWLAPRIYENDHYKDDLEDARQLRHPGTCRWIEKRPEYGKWIDHSVASPCSSLWIRGIPGAGKTVLASYIIDYAAQSSVDPARNLLYFFFKGTDSDKSTPLAATRALIYQLLQLFPGKELFADLERCMEIAAQPRAINYKSLWSLFCQYCSQLRNVLLVLDALDECTDIKFLLPGLLDLSKQSFIKMAFTSRREADLRAALEALPVIEIASADIADDIEAYVDYEVSKRPVLSDPRVRPRIIRILNARSKGMFLWTALMIKELDSLNSINEIDDTLSSTPEDLDGVYGRILSRLHATMKPSKRSLCTRLLKWIVLAKRPLSLEELTEALRMEYATTSSGFNFAQNFLCSGKELELVCGSLVTIRNGAIQLIHVSTKEYLLNPIGSNDRHNGLQEFLVSIVEGSADVANRLICYIPTLIRKDDDGTQPALVDYAYYNWIPHMIDTKPHLMQSYTASMDDFFGHYTIWGEWVLFCLYKQRGDTQLRINIQSLLNWVNAETEQGFTLSLSGSLEHRLRDWSESLLIFLEDYGRSLASNPDWFWRLDPASVQQLTAIQPKAWEERDDDHERHFVLGSQSFSKKGVQLPASRRLPRNTSPDDECGFFHYDQRRDVFFFLDHFAGLEPKLQCQEATTGRRPVPVVDSELQDYSFLSPNVVGAAMSLEAKYLAIVYHLERTNNAGSTSILYTAVWLLQDVIDFETKSSFPWARKVISLEVTLDPRRSYQSVSRVTFAGENYICCPNGLVNLQTGLDEKLPSMSCQSHEHIDTYDLTFSGNGQDLFYLTQDPGIIIHVSRQGTKQSVIDIGHASDPELWRVSHSGQLIMWSQDCNSDFNDYKCYIYDRSNGQTRDLEVPRSRQAILKEFVFKTDDTGLVGIITTYNILQEYETQVIFWNLEDGNREISGLRKLKGKVTGHFLHDINNHLYIVSQERIWNRYDLRSCDLGNVDDQIAEQTPDRIIYEISLDGSELAVIYPATGRCVPASINYSFLTCMTG